MIAPRVIEQIQALLRQGELSQRRIARQLGVSRGTVQAVATGRREPRRVAGTNHTAESLPFRAGPLERCPGCGGMVYMPCLACHVRSIRERRRRAGVRESGTNRRPR